MVGRPTVKINDISFTVAQNRPWSHLPAWRVYLDIKISVFSLSLLYICETSFGNTKQALLLGAFNDFRHILALSAKPRVVYLEGFFGCKVFSSQMGCNLRLDAKRDKSGADDTLRLWIGFGFTLEHVQGSCRCCDFENFALKYATTCNTSMLSKIYIIMFKIITLLNQFVNKTFNQNVNFFQIGYFICIECL